MDMKCEYHQENGRGKGDHSLSWKATALEQVVVHSFGVVEPGDFIGTREFEGWTLSEIDFACNHTNDWKRTIALMFDRETTSAKLRSYVATHEGAADVFKRYENIKEGSTHEAVYKCIVEWSGGLDPLIYLYMLRQRNATMSGKMNRLRNSVNVWKGEAEKHSIEIGRLKNRIRFMKKGID
jgi:hypothetical protein